MRPLLAPIRAMRSRLGLTTLTREEHGQDLLEYGLLAALIAIVALAAVATKVVVPSRPRALSVAAICLVLGRSKASESITTTSPSSIFERIAIRVANLIAFLFMR